MIEDNHGKKQSLERINLHILEIFRKKTGLILIAKVAYLFKAPISLENLTFLWDILLDAPLLALDPSVAPCFPPMVYNHQ